MGKRHRAVRAALMAIAAVAVIGALGASTASAESNGVGRTPAMGWSTWSFLRHDPTPASVEANARAMVTSGLAQVGYTYVNLDDFWYVCPGSQGPKVDRYGRWIIDTQRFPNQGSRNGIQALADYVHHLGLKFGIYVTPGISKQAVAANTAIEGTSYHADDIATTTPENNYNCGGMVGIDYSKPGAQAFIDSWAREFASWGVDYVKIDGVGSFDIPDIRAWSTALRHTGRPIHLELSNSLNIADASTWATYSNGWRTGGDIECYCSSSSYPLTDWSNVASRFDSVAAWAPYGHPGAYNDYDSIEVGNGANDGLTPPERQTQMSLWALGSSPFILGTDLTHLNPTDLSYLRNRSVISVDQDRVDATRISDTSSAQVFAKTERSGDAVVGLFNTSGAPEVIRTSTSAIGLRGGGDALLRDLWTHRVTETTGAIRADVPSHGVALLRVSRAAGPRQAPPSVVVSVRGPAVVHSHSSATARVVITNDGPTPARAVRLRVLVPSGWSTQPPVSVGTVPSQRTVTASFRVTAPTATAPLSPATITAHATWTSSGGARQSASAQATTTLLGPPVSSGLSTYSSATDAPAYFAQVGTRYGIDGAGTDVYSGHDTYSAIYSPKAVGPTATVQTEVVSQLDMAGFAKAGIMVRNDIAGAGTTPEGVILFESPAGGIQLESDNNGGLYIDAVTPANGTIPTSLPVWLKLVRSGAGYTGYYSTNDTTWQLVGTATVPGQASTQDAGMFSVSAAPGSPGQVTFDGFEVTSG